jgi:class 3 adenylate cyclase
MDTIPDVEPEQTYVDESHRLLRKGDPFLALEQVLTGLQSYPGSAPLRKQHVRVLARTGSPRPANAMLRHLVEEGHSDPETLGLLAGTYKALGLSSGGAPNVDLLRQARDLYLEAHRVEGDPWPGVNAATLSLMLGDGHEAVRMASLVRAETLQRLMHASPADEYWLRATLGEIALISGNLAEAEECYKRGEPLAWGLGDLLASRRNARALLRQGGFDPAALDGCFGIPVVVLFSGHMIDRPGRRIPRFPAEREGVIAEQIREHLQRYGKVVGYSAAAAGGDILFHEAVRALGGESHVVLPCPEDEFVEESVPSDLEGNWRKRFKDVLDHAKDARRVTIASDQKAQTHGASYEYSNLLRDGLAILHARQMDSSVVRMVLWDGGPGDGPGGTASVATGWQAQGHEVERIATGFDAGDGARSSPSPARDDNMKLVGILFADALHFSAIVEPCIPHFVEHFMGAVAGALAKSSVRPLVKNTWGDGLYFVCESPHETATLALDLCDAISAVDWRTRQLPADLALRIGLHAGPAYYCVDPVLGAWTFFGAHVSRAARIEPVTPPGHVYASQAFAAIAAAQGPAEFAMDYVGRVRLAKSAGITPMYRLSRKGAE